MSLFLNQPLKTWLAAKWVSGRHPFDKPPHVVFGQITGSRRAVDHKHMNNEHHHAQSCTANTLSLHIFAVKHRKMRIKKAAQDMIRSLRHLTVSPTHTVDQTRHKRWWSPGVLWIGHLPLSRRWSSGGHLPAGQWRGLTVSPVSHESLYPLL